MRISENELFDAKTAQRLPWDSGLQRARRPRQTAGNDWTNRHLHSASTSLILLQQRPISTNACQLRTSSATLLRFEANDNVLKGLNQSPKPVDKLYQEQAVVA